MLKEDLEKMKHLFMFWCRFRMLAVILFFVLFLFFVGVCVEKNKLNKLQRLRMRNQAGKIPGSSCTQHANSYYSSNCNHICTPSTDKYDSSSHAYPTGMV